MEGNDPTRAERVDDLLHEGLQTGFKTQPYPDPRGPNGSPSITLQKGMKSSADRALLAVFSEIEKMGSLLKLPDGYLLEAKQLYSKFERVKPQNARFKKDVLSATMLYLACKTKGTPRTPREISVEVDVSEATLKKYFALVSKIMKLNLDTTSPSALIPRFCSNLGLGFDYQRFSSQVAEKAASICEGKHPASIAAACLFLTLQLSLEKKTLAEVSAASGVSSTTISSLYYSLSEKQNEIVPPNFWSSKIVAKG